MAETHPVDYIVPEPLDREALASSLREAGLLVDSVHWKGLSDDEVRVRTSYHNQGYISQDGEVKYNAEVQASIVAARAEADRAQLQRMYIPRLFLDMVRMGNHEV